MNVLDTNVVSRFLRPRAVERTPVLYDLVSREIERQGLAIAQITRYEILRGLRRLAGGPPERQHEARKKLVAFEKLLDHTEVLGLEVPGDGWKVAAELWARGKLVSPALNVSEGDLLVLATAAVHDRRLVTCDARLAEACGRLGLACTCFPDR